MEFAMFKNILIPVDGSDHAIHALDVACDLAQKYGATLCLVHASPPLFTDVMMSEADIEAILMLRTQAGEAVLQRAKEHAEVCVSDITTELREAPDAEAILEVAATHNCDLIVMGTRGLGRLAGLLLGSVSQKVVQHARCPVLLVR
jgi:nucleotide-binding universal stress UspA family protein